MPDLGGFLLAFPALFSIVNPAGGALIFSQVMAARTHAERATLARRIALYSLLVLLVSLWAGSYVLSFFGITLAALRIAGGLVVATRAWSLLNAPETTQARKERQAEPARGATPETRPPIDDIAFFPLTMPFTTGPGTISVAVALGSERPHDSVLAFFAGVSAAAAALAAPLWVANSLAHPLIAQLGPGGPPLVTRLAAFLLLCIGTQITLGGVEDVLRPLLHP